MTMLCALPAALLLAGCAGGQRLSDAMGAINREYAALQDQAMLTNILRRSVGLPAHFVTLTTVRGRSRFSAGATLAIPFGADASSRFELSPNLSIQQGPSFEVSTQANQEFYRGYLAPLRIATAHAYLGRDLPRELVLSLLVERIRLREPGGREQVVENTVDQPATQAAFQRVLERLVNEGLTSEEVDIVRDVGPRLRPDDPPTLDQILRVRDKGLEIEEVPSEDEDTAGASAAARRLQLRHVVSSARFCFRRPSGPPFSEARCRDRASIGDRRIPSGDKRLFGTADSATAILETGDSGLLEIRLRSLADILDYLGEAARMQLRGDASAPTVRSFAGRTPVIVVMPEALPGARSIVAVDFDGTRYGIPAGSEGGHSGRVLTIVSQLLAQAQSVRDLPASGAVTILGD